MAGTFALDRLAQQAAAAGAKLLLVGDPHQLSPVETGGAFGLLTVARSDTPRLTVVRRFTDADGSRRLWEEHAAAAVRLGDNTAADAYLEHERLAGGSGDEMTEAAYAGWLADVRTGRSSLLIAADNDSVHDLNERARADLVKAGAVDDSSTVRLHDGLPAGRGDVIVTREIDRYLSDGTGQQSGGRRTDGFVRNGQRWTVDRARRDGSLTVRLLGDDGTVTAAGVTLPANYVAQHVDLGYATTAHRAQGMTTQTAHVLATAAMSRETFYVAMTRGRRGNQAYLVTDPPTPGGAVDGADVHLHGSDSEPWTRREVINAILANTSATPSAHEMIRTEQDAAGSIAQLAAEAETIASHAHEAAAAELVFAALGDAPATRALIDDPDFGEVVNACRSARNWQLDLDHAVVRLTQDNRPDNAAELGELIRFWASTVTAMQRQPHRRMVAGILPDATQGLADPQMLEALKSRYELIERRADSVLDRAIVDDSPWVRHLPPAQLGRTAEWRSAARIAAAYRDRWHVTHDGPVGKPPEQSASYSQQADYRRAKQAIAAIGASRRRQDEPGGLGRSTPDRSL